MPDTNPTPAQVKARQQQDASDKETSKFLQYGSKFQKVGNAPRSYTPAMQQKLLQEGGYNPNTLTKSAEQDRALEAGERQEYLKQFKWSQPSAYKRGGRVRKTGLALVHKGEKVVPRRKSESQRKKG